MTNVSHFAKCEKPTIEPLLRITSLKMLVFEYFRYLYLYIFNEQPYIHTTLILLTTYYPNRAFRFFCSYRFLATGGGDAGEQRLRKFH